MACFEYEASPLSWAAAEAACGTRGAHLARIASEGENELVRRLCTEACWIGYNDIAAETVWAWSDGATSNGSYTNWIPGEPNGQALEQTDAAYVSVSTGKWDDTDTAHPKAYVCRRELDSAPPYCDSIKHSVLLQEYGLDHPRDGVLTYEDSVAFAAAQGGRLATLTEVQAFMETCKLYCTEPACSDRPSGSGTDRWAAVTIPSTNPSASNDGRDWVQIGIRYGNDMGKSHRLIAGYPTWADTGTWPNVVWTLTMPPPQP